MKVPLHEGANHVGGGGSSAASSPPGPVVEAEGVIFRIFAPDRGRVEVVLLDADGGTEIDTIELVKNTFGFFETKTGAAGPGSLYKLRVDGEGPYPDPFSRSQPRGVHGPSAIIDHAFPWTDGAHRGVSLEDLVIYEVHVGTATPEGTFDGLIGRLDDIRALGATAIELMPITSFPGRWNWGYDGVSLFAPAAVYGGPAGLRRLIDAAHAAGLAVLIDAVYNHLGPDGNYLPAISPRYFTKEHKTPWGDAFRLDGEGSAPVREALLASAEMWIRDYHADGLRLDATHTIPDASEPHILRAIADRARTAGAGRRVIIIAEDERNDVRLITPAELGGLGLDGVWADDFHHQLRRAFAGDSDGYYGDYTGTTEDIAATIRAGWFYRGQMSKHLRKARGTPPEGVPPPRFVYCIQNHDQIGNRALGDRLGASVSPSSFRAMSALLLLSPYTPLLFMGQEWNAKTPFLYFTDHHEELGRAVTMGRTGEFKDFAAWSGCTVPDPQDLATFERSKLSLREREEPEHRGVLAWYRELLALRREHPALRSRSRDDYTASAIGEGAVLLERRTGSSRLILLINIRGHLDYTIENAPALRVIAWSETPRFGGSPDTPPPLTASRIRFETPGALIIQPESP